MAARAKTQPALTPFDGRQVFATTVIITNAGDGLSDALEVDPEEYHHGDVVHVVLRCTVNKVRFDPVKDTEGLRRVHVFRAEEATVVDADLVEEHLSAQRDRIEADRVRREEEEGIHRLPFDGDRTAEPDPLGAFEGEEDLGPMPTPTPARKRPSRAKAKP